ncbi:conserved hypothetical protein [Trichinella spiralis]|uniref:hypothetical protein n=1 Tax=Trichinella spiralis TaxID=6334 RepID=UPI0001EFEA28|nr:conserved hypothetical protein [Trichinella spiralis]
MRKVDETGKANSSFWVAEIWQGAFQTFVVVKGNAVQIYNRWRCREWPAGIQFFLVEGVAGENTIRFVWRKWRSGIQFFLVGVESDGRVSNSLLVAGVARACATL